MCNQYKFYGNRTIQSCSIMFRSVVGIKRNIKHSQNISECDKKFTMPLDILERILVYILNKSLRI